MFAIILRAAVTLLIAAPAIWAWREMMSPALEELAGIAGEDATTVGYLTNAVEWFALVALLMILVYIVVGAIEERQSPGRGF